MLQQDHVIQIDLPPEKHQKDDNNEANSRRTSYCSQRSSASDAQLVCVSPNYDSGNFSCSNTSDLSYRPNSYSSEDDCNDFNGRRVPSTSSLQSEPSKNVDVKSLRNELERLSKSEKWYKNELKTQKRSKLDLLEKLYLNERKFIRENQKLQMDCKRLYGLCDEIERRTLQEKDDLVRQLRQLQRLFESLKFADPNDQSGTVNPKLDSLLFETQKQKSIIQEHENLIKVLRTQKQNLLHELKTVTTERDLKILEIEKKLLSLEYENRTITARYVALVQEKKTLEDRNRQIEEDLQKSITDGDKTKLQSNASERRLAEELQENIRLGLVISNLQNDKFQKISELEKELEAKDEELEKLRSCQAIQNARIISFETDNLKLHDLEELVQKYETERRDMDAIVEQLEKDNIQTQEENSHLRAEIVQYQKLRENFDRYVSLLQGNSAELDSKCSEIEQLKSVIELQTTQISELSLGMGKFELLKEKFDEAQSQLTLRTVEAETRSNEILELQRQLVERDGKILALTKSNEQWQKLLEEKNNQLLVKEDDLLKKEGLLVDLTKRHEAQQAELTTAKEKQLSMEKYQEKLILQLQSEGNTVTLKNFEIEELKENAEELKTENQELKNLLDVKNEHISELEKQENIIPSLRSEINSLKAIVQEQKHQIEDATSQLFAKDQVITTLKNKLDPEPNLSKMLTEIHALKSIVFEQKSKIDELTQENFNLKQTKSNDSNLERFFIEAKLESCEKIHQFRQSPLTDCSKCELIRKEKDDLLLKLNQLRETSLKVPETCDSQCQVTNDPVDDVQQLKLLQKVKESEHRKQLSRYDVHISTLLGKIKSYKNRLAVKHKTDVDAKKLAESEKKVAILNQQLNMALKRSADLNAFKTSNSQLKFSLKSLMENYKTVLQVLHKPEKTNICYDAINDLIEKSNKLVPNFDSLKSSIDGLKDDFSRSVVTGPGRRVSSLMDELKAAEAFAIN